MINFLQLNNFKEKLNNLSWKNKIRKVKKKKLEIKKNETNFIIID
jgi:hypothetical protein